MVGKRGSRSRCGKFHQRATKKRASLYSASDRRRARLGTIVGCAVADQQNEASVHHVWNRVLGKNYGCEAIGASSQVRLCESRRYQCRTGPCMAARVLRSKNGSVRMASHLSEREGRWHEAKTSRRSNREGRPRLDRPGAREAPLCVKGDDFQISRASGGFPRSGSEVALDLIQELLRIG